MPVGGEIPSFDREGPLLSPSPKFRVSCQHFFYAAIMFIIFSAADLTTLVKRLNKTHQNFGSFGNVHTCKLYLRGTIQQVVFRYQSHSMSNCVDVGALPIISFDLPDFNLGRSQGNKCDEQCGHVEICQGQ